MYRPEPPISSDSLDGPVAGGGDFPAGGKKFAARRLLVVDDEPLIRWSVAETFRDLGCEVQVAGTAAEALLAASSPDRFDAVLLDLRLPDSNDLALLDLLRAAEPAARIILMTAYATSELRQGALARGVFCVLNKPFQLSELPPLVY